MKTMKALTALTLASALLFGASAADAHGKRHHRHHRARRHHHASHHEAAVKKAVEKPAAGAAK